MQGKSWIVALVAALPLAIVAVNCGGSDTNGSGKACTADTDCASSELCHPDAKECVKKCTQASDCPKSAPVCDVLGSSSGSFCQCSSTDQCGGGTGSTAICSTVDKICETKCGSDTDCPGRICDTSTGQCTAGCNTSADCGGDLCDTSTHHCTANQCTTTAAQPAECAYGKFCTTSGSNGVCQDVPQGTCTQASSAPVWASSSGTAPVIVSATATALSSTNANTECANGDPAGLVTINFYAPGGIDLANDNAADFLLHHVEFRTSTTNTTFFAGNFLRGTPPGAATSGTVQVGIGCGNATGSAAVYILNENGQTSNVVCVSW